MKYPIVEIFASIQGEGIQMGVPTTFIRFGGCNLSCTWCDTKFDVYTEMSTDQILSKVVAFGTKYVVLTGGEPTLQNLTDLLFCLRNLDYRVGIETNGTNPVETKYPDLFYWITCSPKPESGYAINMGVQPSELKYVVDDEFHSAIIPGRYKELPIWLQPEGFNMQKSAQSAYEMVMAETKRYPNMRLGCQLHKIFELR